MIIAIDGPAGTGKSTISKVLSDTEGKYPECFIDWTDDTPLDVLTYNKDFQDRNIVENMPGIFTLGEATIEEELEEKPQYVKGKKKGDCGYIQFGDNKPQPISPIKKYSSKKRYYKR